MTIKVYNLNTGEFFTLHDRPMEIAKKLRSELLERDWDEKLCRIEILEGDENDNS